METFVQVVQKLLVKIWGSFYFLSFTEASFIGSKIMDIKIV